MSEFDIQLKSRTAHIEVKEILEQREEGAAGLPEMDILDIRGKKHTISAADLSGGEFKGIKPGTIIHVNIHEKVVNIIA